MSSGWLQGRCQRRCRIRVSCRPSPRASESNNTIVARLRGPTVGCNRRLCLRHRTKIVARTTDGRGCTFLCLRTLAVRPRLSPLVFRPKPLGHRGSTRPPRISFPFRPDPANRLCSTPCASHAPPRTSLRPRAAENTFSYLLNKSYKHLYPSPFLLPQPSPLLL